MTHPPTHLINAMERNRVPNDERIIAARVKAQEAVELANQIKELEDQLATVKRQHLNVIFDQLPALMDAAGVDRLGLPAHGNYPAMNVELTPYYKANIAAGWPEEKRQAAFTALTELGHEDLIKTEITIAVPRGEHHIVQDLLDMIACDYGLAGRAAESVHSSTLSAWLREQIEANNPLPPLDVIGATVGRIAQIKERKL